MVKEREHEITRWWEECSPTMLFKVFGDSRLETGLHFRVLPDLLYRSFAKFLSDHLVFDLVLEKRKRGSMEIQPIRTEKSRDHDKSSETEEELEARITATSARPKAIEYRPSLVGRLLHRWSGGTTWYLKRTSAVGTLMKTFRGVRVLPEGERKESVEEEHKKITAVKF